ncbi:hypothetical protein [Bordetella sp. N]|uniref:hypothetical protein n=1 Tax=Bordetella sp. N TaxID=1746199 RepID=UPI0012E3F816|nr:hypothetical protein [Bordetella sp. N]
MKWRFLQIVIRQVQGPVIQFPTGWIKAATLVDNPAHEQLNVKDLKTDESGFVSSFHRPG